MTLTDTFLSFTVLKVHELLVPSFLLKTWIDASASFRSSPANVGVHSKRPAM
jgi:hypothetical protein